MNRIVAYADRHYPSVHPAERWRFLVNAHGRYWPEVWLDMNRMSDAERMEVEAAHTHHTANPATDEVPISFPSLDLAVEWANLEDAEACLNDDATLYHAPGEATMVGYAYLGQRRIQLELEAMR